VVACQNHVNALRACVRLVQHGVNPLRVSYHRTPVCDGE